MSEKSKIRMTFVSPSGHLMCLPLDKYEEYRKNQPGYKHPPKLTLHEKVVEFVGEDNLIGFHDGIIRLRFSVDQLTEYSICIEFEKEGLIKKDKTIRGEKFWRFINKDVEKMMEIITKHIKK